MKIVIIEDEIRIREGLARLINKLDRSYEVVGTAENGKEGLEIIRREMPDIIITDIRMPVMDGLEMLTALHEAGINRKTIVLSAYSEFEYARQAMRMGIKEYLLKPLAVSDISEAIHRVSEELEQEKKQSEGIIGSADQVFSALAAGTLEINDQIKKRVERTFGIPENSLYSGICLYLGIDYDHNKQQARRELDRMFRERENSRYILMEIAREKTIAVLVYQDHGCEKLDRWVQYRLLKDRNRTIKGAVGFIADMQMEEIKSGLETLMKYMDWNISLGDGIMISYPKITKLQTSPCVYPLELEKEMKLAVCAGDGPRIKSSLIKFRSYFSEGKVYHPKEIKECCVRFLWALINTGKEVGTLRYESLEQQRLLERIMGARTVRELNEAEDFLADKFSIREEESVHLMVKKARDLIHEFYQTGITLEEIAAKLNLTPEYLGTRFHQELGMTFSAYIKNLRMKKAKELLIGTNLKLYEIAAKIGYAEPKYFSRVFKEETGMLPADYRKTHK